MVEKIKIYLLLFIIGSMKLRSLIVGRKEYVRNIFFKVLFCINGKKDVIKLLIFGIWMSILEYVILINY